MRTTLVQPSYIHLLSGDSQLKINTGDFLTTFNLSIARLLQALAWDLESKSFLAARRGGDLT